MRDILNFIVGANVAADKRRQIFIEWVSTMYKSLPAIVLDPFTRPEDIKTPVVSESRSRGEREGVE